MMIERVKGASFAQEILRILTGTVDGVNESNFDFSGFECFPDKIDVLFVTAGVLNLALAEFDLAGDSAQHLFFALAVSGFGDVPGDKRRRVSELRTICLDVLVDRLSP